MNVFKDSAFNHTHEPFIIAEAGINHNGDLDLAKQMVLSAKEAGADAVKFQTFHAEEFIQDRTATYTYKSQGKEITESMLEMFKRNEFSVDEWFEIKRFCVEQNITFLSTPQNETDLTLLLKIGIGAIKVGSDDFVNIPLIKRYAKEKLPMLLSCGMANKDEIEITISSVRDISPAPIVLFLCTSQYPTPPEDVNITKLTTLRQNYPNITLGLSDHTQGIEAAVMATALGAKFFEKHFTLSHDFKGPDHWFSADPTELKEWVNSIRLAHKMLGSSELKPTNSELSMRKIAHRSITVLKDIKKGDLFSEQNIGMRRPGEGIPGSMWDNVVGKSACRDLIAGTQLTWEDING